MEQEMTGFLHLMSRWAEKNHDISGQVMTSKMVCRSIKTNEKEMGNLNFL